MAKMGRPIVYKKEFCDKILSKDLCGKHIVQIARTLGVCKDTIYDWEKKYPEFAQALNMSRTYRHAKLFDDYDDNVTTGKDWRFSEKAHAEQFRYSGFGRRLPKAVGVADELETLQVVQDALANDEITSDYAESFAKLINVKREARLTNELALEVKAIKAKLGIE